MLEPGFDVDKARKLLEKADHLCLISNSLRGTRTLVTDVSIRADALVLAEKAPRQ
jgi:organic hydroperoxide reductase OsmC/OhrA